MKGLLVKYRFIPLAAILALVDAAVGADTHSANLLQSVQGTCSRLINAPAHLASLKELATLSQRIDSEELKSSVVATYALGMYYGGRDESAKKAVQYLQRTFPETPDLRYFDAAQYQADCPKCSGAGTVEVPCERCAGSRQCASCSGRGRIAKLGRRYDACTFCGGSGACRACERTGRETTTCSRCFGAGKVTSTRLIRTAYLAALEKTRAAAFAEEQAAKGLIEFEGAWMTPDEKQREVERRQTLAEARRAETERQLAEAQRRQAAEKGRLARQKTLLQEKQRQAERDPPEPATVEQHLQEAAKVLGAVVEQSGSAPSFSIPDMDLDPSEWQEKSFEGLVAKMKGSALRFIWLAILLGIVVYFACAAIMLLGTRIAAIPDRSYGKALLSTLAGWVSSAMLFGLCFRIPHVGVALGLLSGFGVTAFIIHGLFKTRFPEAVLANIFTWALTALLCGLVVLLFLTIGLAE